MSRPVPLRELAHSRLIQPDSVSWLDTVGFLPMGRTELQLAAHRFPLAVRRDDGRHRLGVLTAPELLRQALHEEGRWRGGYQPIAMRCHPFTLLDAPADAQADPLARVAIDPASAWLDPARGVALLDEQRRAGPLADRLLHYLTLIEQSQQDFAPAIDRLLMAQLLTRLGQPTERAGETLVIDPRAAAHYSPEALAALGRRDYLAVDIMIAGLFSLQALRPDCRPAAPRAGSQGAAAATMAELEELPLLDEGELVDIALLVTPA